MEFKKGIGWRCCYDPETGLYTAETGGGPNHDLYEITKEIYDRVDDPDVEYPSSLISEGRHLYMAVDDRCGPPYTVILDTDYQKLCPWATTMISGKVWDEDMTDAAVEVFASEANNREQRRKKRAEREKRKKGKSDERTAPRTLSNCSGFCGVTKSLALPPTLKVDFGASGSFSLYGIFASFNMDVRKSIMGLL